VTGCERWGLLIQADLDGELDVASAASLAAHIETCPDCAALQSRLAALSARLRAEVPRARAPEALRELLLAEAPPPPSNILPFAPPAPRGRTRSLVSFGAGAALAACLALVLMPRGGTVTDELVASHVRAMQPGHLMDVLSTDQHTVKPWFNGRVDFAPPVKDLASAGFPLTGGRLDTVGKRTVAVLIYGSDKHVIDLFVWPDAEARALPLETEDGFNVIGWQSGGMAFRAVSDVEASKLADFARHWQTAP
jgi:anti-sigma factor RsiW